MLKQNPTQPLTGPEIIERVSIGIQQVIKVDVATSRNIAKRMIDDVLATIQEPSPAMIEAGLTAKIDDSASLAHIVWHAMIDALKREIAG